MASGVERGIDPLNGQGNEVAELSERRPDQHGGAVAARRLHLRRTVGLAAFSAIVAGCAREIATDAAPDLLRPRAASYCTMGPAVCDQIGEQIAQLRVHTSQTCRDYGNAAQDRFYSATEGYEAGNILLEQQDPTLLAYVEMGPGNSPSGDVPLNGSVFVTTLGRIQLDEVVRSMIAHEEVHQAGQENRQHSTGWADIVGSMCSTM